MRFLFLLLLVTQLSAQNTPLSGIINHYAAVTALDTCNGAFMVTDTAGFHAGDHILILQAQGAQIAAGNNSNYGQVLNMQAAGRSERAVVDSVSATTIFLKNHWVNVYEVAGRVQVVTIPQYIDAVVTDTVRALPWDGHIGGVLALDVAGILTLNAPLSADGAGFRGGLPYFVTANNCTFAFPQTFYYYALGNWRGGYKGEGVSLPITEKELGRGPQANGGGGGNDHNSGGGGGGNISDGGRGGDNNEPNSLGCSGHYPGIGGYSVLFTEDRMLFGGGGGAGHANNGLTTAGASGGGVILLQADSITGSAPLISASGYAAGTGGGDGGGGGGAGGTIWLNVAAADTNLVVRADGGNGGNTINNGNDRCAGPGGGGSGGRILTNLLTVAPPVGGQPGIITNSSNGCNGTNAGAEVGETGFVQALTVLQEGTLAADLPVITTEPQPVSACAGMDTVLVVGTNSGVWSYQWQVLNGGVWLDLINTTFYNGAQSDSLRFFGLTTAFDSNFYRVVVKYANCAEVVSAAALLRVGVAPTAGFTSTIDDMHVAFLNQSTQAAGYFWDFGDNTTSTAANPQHTYSQEGIYTVTLLAINACDTATSTQIIVLVLPPTAGFALADSTADCLLSTVTFQNLSSANVDGYQWNFPGGTPASSTLPQPTVAYTSSGSYTAQLIVSNPAGQDTLSQTFQVVVAVLPIADFDYVVQPGGVVVFTNQHPDGATFIWDFGDSSTVSSSVHAVHQYSQSGTYVVTLAVSNPCGAAILQQNVEVTVAGVATKEELHLGRVRLFPNPVGEQLTVDCSAANALPSEIRILDASGRLLFSQRADIKLFTQISLAGWPSGAYSVVLRFAEGQVVRGIVH